MRITSSRTAAVAGLSCLAVLVGDLATKALVRRELGGGRIIELPFGARLEHGENRGVAFGLFSGAGDIVLIVALIAVAGLALMLFVHRPASPGTLLAAALLVGGALANLVDRVGDGAVTDFIDLGAWPTFNLADVAITLGVALFVLPIARRPTSGTRKRSPGAPKPAAIAPAASGHRGGEGRVNRD